MIGVIIGICLILVGLWMMWKGIGMLIEEPQNKITLPINACETCPNYGVRLRVEQERRKKIGEVK